MTPLSMSPETLLHTAVLSGDPEACQETPAVCGRGDPCTQTCQPSRLPTLGEADLDPEGRRLPGPQQVQLAPGVLYLPSLPTRGCSPSPVLRLLVQEPLGTSEILTSRPSSPHRQGGAPSSGLYHPPLWPAITLQNFSTFLAGERRLSCRDTGMRPCPTQGMRLRAPAWAPHTLSPALYLLSRG